MIDEDKIKKLAFSLWEQEGRPNGKDVEHYLKAKEILEKEENEKIFELPPSATLVELGWQPETVKLAPSQPWIALKA